MPDPAPPARLGCPLQRRRLLAALLWPATGWAQAPAQIAPELEQAARAEGRIKSVGMPDHWANWRSTWADLKRLYGLEHIDENMSSAAEIDRMEAEGRHATIDIGDVGYEYAAVARARKVSLAHKPALWAQIPDWAKDADGYWALAYTGTIAFAVNTRRLGSEPVPRSWKALFAGRYTVMIGEVGTSAQANATVLAAAIALGGAEHRLQPALAEFAKLQAQGRLNGDAPNPERMERAPVDVFVLWDFNALAFREKLRNAADYEVLIPSDGSVTSGYTPIINRHAPNPNAAKLARDYIFSDAGQLNLARGYARPIRIAQLQLPEAVSKRLLDAAQYKNARVVQPAIWAWEAKKLGKTWTQEVLKAAPP